MNNEPTASAIRLARVETEVGGLRSDFAEVKQHIERLFSKMETLTTKGSPSWQAIFAFVFSAIMALSVIGGGIAVVVALFVRTETAAINVKQVETEQTSQELMRMAQRSIEERTALLQRMSTVEREAEVTRGSIFTQRDGESLKELLRAEQHITKP